ncbi:hypothetical protein RN001_004333 [Aquatica leii]|uniref:Mitotic-spindle organizing protein 1 n=1 Tax=Aquatica leii TaxID=1421715 RepID=A0AAN7PYC4_9COLE|nr:hypothetical protein RN001_004333 [Aquatica leii]
MFKIFYQNHIVCEIIGNTITHFEMPHLTNTRITEARELFQALLEMSQLLCTGLDPEILTICIRLCELGLHPDVLATIIRELRKEVNRNNDRVLGQL